MMSTGRNSPCPCGSGKKYKNCCQAVECAQRARLRRLHAVRRLQEKYSVAHSFPDSPADFAPEE